MIQLFSDIITNHKVAREGGQLRSDTLRMITKKKYHVDIGLYSYGGCFNHDFNVGGLEVIIGRYCSFATHVHYFGASHPVEKCVMSPFFYNRTLGLNVEDVPRSRLLIGNDVWVGEGVIITKNCKEIGNGAVIGAGTVLTKSVPPYSICYGNPGVVHKYRFDETERQMLNDSQWWTFSPEELMEFYAIMEDPVLFATEILKRKKGNS